MKVENCRIIKTNLWSLKAKEVLSSVLGQLSDGWGENNSRNDRYWMFANVKQLANGNVVIEVSNESCKGEGYNKNFRWIENAFRSMSDKEVLDFFARMVKKTAKMELKDEDPYGKHHMEASFQWSRINTEFKTTYLSYDEEISIAEVYCIYEMLLGRPVGVTKYDAGVINSAVGCQRSDEDTAAEQARLDAISILKSECAKLMKEINEKIEAEKKAIDKKYESIRDEALKSYKEKLASLGYTGYGC